MVDGRERIEILAGKSVVAAREPPQCAGDNYDHRNAEYAQNSESASGRIRCVRHHATIVNYSSGGAERSIVVASGFSLTKSNNTTAAMTKGTR